MNNNDLKILLKWDIMQSTNYYNKENGYSEEHLALKNSKTAIILHHNNIPWRAYEHKNGIYHGVYASLYDGELSQITHYSHGLEDGLSKQYHHGKLIGLYEMKMGTGVNLWFEDTNILSEEHHTLKGKAHGVERWWDTSSNQAVTRECYYYQGCRHGIERQWEYDELDVLHLESDYPKFWINGEETTEEDYVIKSRTDKTLVKYKREENDPHRALPHWIQVSSTHLKGEEDAT